MLLGSVTLKVRRCEISQTLVHDPITVPKSHGRRSPKIPQTPGVTDRLPLRRLNPWGQILSYKEEAELLLKKAPAAAAAPSPLRPVEGGTPASSGHWWVINP